MRRFSIRDRSVQKGGGAIVAGLLLALPLPYVLSVGPAAWLWDRGRMSGKTFSVIYAPILWATEKSNTAHVVYHRYTWWWMGRERPF